MNINLKVCKLRYKWRESLAPAFDTRRRIKMRRASLGAAFGMRRLMPGAWRARCAEFRCRA